MKGYKRRRETGVVGKELQLQGKNEFCQELSHEVEFETSVVHVQVIEYAFTGSQRNGLKVTTAEVIVKDNKIRRQS